MDKLHLVGFTTDLKHLVFARRKGAKTGSFLLAIDERLLRTITEVQKLEEVQSSRSRDGAAGSKLTPKEIQTLLREGKSPEEVARRAEREVGWINRFLGPVIAERAGVIDAVLGATVSKARLGPSGTAVGEAIQSNLRVGPEVFDGGFTAVRRGDRWEARFRYKTRGSWRTATFHYDPDTRAVVAANANALRIAWTAPPPRRRRRPTVAGQGAGRKPRRG